MNHADHHNHGHGHRHSIVHRTSSCSDSKITNKPMLAWTAESSSSRSPPTSARGDSRFRSRLVTAIENNNNDNVEWSWYDWSAVLWGDGVMAWWSTQAHGMPMDCRVLTHGNCMSGSDCDCDCESANNIILHLHSKGGRVMCSFLHAYYSLHHWPLTDWLTAVLCCENLLFHLNIWMWT